MTGDGADSDRLLVQQLVHMIGHDAVLLAPVQHTVELGSVEEQPSSCPVQQAPFSFSTHQASQGLPPYQDAWQHPGLTAAQQDPPPKLCYTVTTGAPMSLQQLQVTSRAICEAQHSMSHASVDLSTGYPAHWLAEPGADNQVPVLACSAGCADLHADGMAALQNRSAQLLKEMQSDDIAQQLQLRVLQKHTRMLEQLAAAVEHSRQQEMQEAAGKRRCLDTRAAAFNNLSVQCGRRPSDHDNRTHLDGCCNGAAVSPNSMHSACTPMHACSHVSHLAGSPHTPTTFNNNGGQGLSPALGQQCFPEPVITAKAAYLLQPPAADSEVVLGITPPGAATHTAARLGSAAPSSAPQKKHLQSSTGGVQSLLKPSEREAAAAEALTEAAYAATCTAVAVHAMNPDATSRIAKQLALAAVHAVKAQQDAAAVCAGQSMVPQVSAYTASPVCHTVTADPSTPLFSPAYTYPASEATFLHYYMQQPHAMSGCRMPSYMQQQGPAQLENRYSGAAWGSMGSALAAGAANAGSSWAPPSFGDWQQSHTGAANTQWEGWAAAAPASSSCDGAFPQPCLQAAQHDEQGYYAQCAEGCTWPFSGYYQQQAHGYCQEQGEQVEDPDGPQSPMLGGVDYWSDRCSLLCFSNPWECAEVFQAEACAGELVEPL